MFVAGDAAHAHSPAGGQGMNNGILDGLNLGWKLGFASGNGPLPGFLESYEQERKLAARRVLALTHVIFFGEASPHPAARLLRFLLPYSAPLLPVLLRRRALTSMGIRLLAQPFVRYRHSPISVDCGPPARLWPRPGDRLPDFTVTTGNRTLRLHELTSVPGIHVLLERDTGFHESGLADGPADARVHVHRLISHPGTAVVAVRPDGYVGFRSSAADLPRLRAWLELVGAASRHGTVP
jgi:hypothetical protein